MPKIILIGKQVWGNTSSGNLWLMKEKFCLLMLKLKGNALRW